MNENEQALQTMVEYYRNKCNKLEHDFLIYKINAEKIIRSINANAPKSEQDSTEESNGNSVSEN
jgi:tellurite resistance protein